MVQLDEAPGPSGGHCPAGRPPADDDRLRPARRTGHHLVDPLVPGGAEPLLVALDEVVRVRVRIFVTAPFNVHGSELFWRRPFASSI
jgi:hypothetical protein